MFMLYDQDEIQRITIVDAKKQGLEQGLEQGEKSATRKIVFRMLKNNKSDEDIIEITEISADELQQFKTEYANA